jgi:hypothetical protein
VKTLHIASILALSVSLTFACGDDDDASSPGAAGSGGTTAGADNGGAPTDNGGAPTDNGGAPTDNGGAPSAAGGDNNGGVPPVETCEFGEYGEGGAGGAAGAGGADGAGLEVLGTWKDEFEGGVTITPSYWGRSGIAAYDSEANVVYTQTPCDADYNPGRFTKIVYTQPQNDTFYYCMVVYDAKTLAEAQASDKSADQEDLEGGCGASFPWSKLTR